MAEPILTITPALAADLIDEIGGISDLHYRPCLMGLFLILLQKTEGFDLQTPLTVWLAERIANGEDKR